MLNKLDTLNMLLNIKLDKSDHMANHVAMLESSFS